MGFPPSLVAASALAFASLAASILAGISAEGRCPVVTAGSMDEAIFLAHQSAAGTGTVLLSPGCSSFDWYNSYDERGRDFERLVGVLTGTVEL